MRYYFHLENDESIHIDHLGKDFEYVESAKVHAASVARKLAATDRWQGWSLRVIDARNAEVTNIPIQDTLLHS
ncbi:hypothetical protein [uncultured Hyphomicrobium sp.]|uniref:DUF6894 family protein n=1 Tax=uncultured Hyphomicrobium sp. TaxID=194373 RepID=UPI0025DBC255|nr:hypothetical protein [uncultured Hyphomicrobium sp.]